jgi:hypothetical protein
MLKNIFFYCFSFKIPRLWYKGGERRRAKGKGSVLSPFVHFSANISVVVNFKKIAGYIVKLPTFAVNIEHKYSKRE